MYHFFSRAGSLPRVVRKRTPRVPFNYADKDKEKGSSPAKQRLKFIMDDDDVTHELAMALTNASQRSDSRKVSRVGNRKKESARRSPLQDAGRMVIPNLFHFILRLIIIRICVFFFLFFCKDVSMKLNNMNSFLFRARELNRPVQRGITLVFMMAVAN